MLGDGIDLEIAMWEYHDELINEGCYASEAVQRVVAEFGGKPETQEIIKDMNDHWGIR